MFFVIDHLVDHGLSCGHVECVDASEDDAECEDMPHRELIGVEKCGEYDGLDERCYLCGEQYAEAVIAVGCDAAEYGEHERWELSAEGGDAEHEGRMCLIVDDPVDGGSLHPCTDE